MSPKTPQYPRRLRPGQPADLRLVLDSWARSYRRSPWAGTVPGSLWNDVVRRSITAILARGSLTVAVHPEDDALILGWIAWEDGPSGVIVHYTYVKDPWRQDGVASELLEHVTGTLPWRFTHRTPSGERLLRRFPDGVWDPFPARKDA